MEGQETLQAHTFPDVQLNIHHSVQTVRLYRVWIMGSEEIKAFSGFDSSRFAKAVKCFCFPTYCII